MQGSKELLLSQQVIDTTQAQPDGRLHADEGDHRVSHGWNGGQEMTRNRTRYSSRLRQACDREERRGDHLDQRGAHHERRGA